jgi:hypothetical protein
MMKVRRFQNNKKKVIYLSIYLFYFSNQSLTLSIIEKDKNFDDDDNDIMSHLNYRKLEEIKKDFMKNEEQGLSLD